ncbi:SMC family ATPase [Actinoallomurus sp. NBC_01490]|uniref:SMC family ATPase n=1 Tax=Actinoallomurus sp. NBC_01490 TaxID=2903557 RepID=UPI002E308A1A|nr:SMC family ATPase [Actinoallomurus sp. NBC_01490]
MRLHALTITAFGPYAGTETVDFEALSDAGLFLINGPTGAGKTSVLDAVCFALYGRVPSVRNDAKDLRSQHAPPDRAPEVVLDVTIRGRRFKVTRSPKWERPKRRGQGTTEEKAKVLLQEWRGGAWETWSTRFDEAGQLVTDLLGMSAEQFCQVVLLPQGDFAAFLRAGAEDRRAVLEKLFATEVFAQVEAWLAERRRESGRAADELRLAAESVADRAAEAAGAARPELTPPALAAWAIELSGHAADFAAVTAAGAAGAGAARDAARTLLDDARAVADRQERHADALRRSAELAARADERTGLTGRLRAAERAGRVLPRLQTAAARAARRDEVAAVVTRRRAELGGLLPDDADADLMRKEERARRDELVELAQRREDETRLTAIGAELRTLADEADDLETREAELALFLTDSPVHRDLLRAQLDQARTRAAALPAADAAVAEATARLEAARRRDALAASLAEAEAAHRAAVDEAQAARDVVQEIRQARLEGMAASLAKELAEGEPCRVCGSASHPSPAHAEADGPGEEAEAEAAAAYDAALARREETGNTVTRLAAELDAARDRAGSSPEPELASALAAAEDDLTGLAGAEADIARIEDELRHVDAEFEEARDRHGEVQTALAALQTQRTTLTAEAGRLRARIDAARGDDPTLEARIRRLDHEAALLRDTAAATEQLRAAAEEAETASDEASAAAAAEGFDSAEAARAAALDDTARQELARRVKAYDDEEARVAALLDDPSLRAAAAEPPPDLAALESALRTAEEHHQSVASARDRFADRRSRLVTLAGELHARAAEWRPAAEHHSLAARVAALTSGDPTANRTRMRLSAYVLAARLEQVVAAANERLARMSGARYALEHTVDKAAGSRGHGTGGLGLRVIDGWTGRHREPGTLSGGETFITSLSLALGLADVVTAEAGGTEIGTLFVDEGFGTLDEDTLDEVMAVLDGLRDGGRAVGIVSHVAELRTRIPAQLRVAKTRTGSTLTVTT